MKLTKLLSVLFLAILCSALLSGQAFAASEAGGSAACEETVSYTSVTDDFFSWLDENVDTSLFDDPATAADEGMASLWTVVAVTAAVLGALFLIFGASSWKFFLRIFCFLGGFIGAFIGYTYLFTLLLNTTLDTNVVGLSRFFLNAPIAQCIVSALVGLLCFFLTRFIFRVALFGGTMAAVIFFVPSFVTLPEFAPFVIGAVLGLIVAFPLAKPILALLSSALAGVLLSFAVSELYLYGYAASFISPKNVLNESEAVYLEQLFLAIAAAIAGVALFLNILVAIIKAVKRKNKNDSVSVADIKENEPCDAPETSSAAQPALTGKALKLHLKSEEMSIREREQALRLELMDRKKQEKEDKKRAKEEKETEKLQKLLSQAEKRYAKKYPEDYAAQKAAAAEAAVAEDVAAPIEAPETEAVSEVAVAMPVATPAIEAMPASEPVAEKAEAAKTEQTPAPVASAKEKPKMVVSRDCSDCTKCGLRPYCKSPKAKVCRPEYCATCNARRVCKAPLNK